MKWGDLSRFTHEYFLRAKVCLFKCPVHFPNMLAINLALTLTGYAELMKKAFLPLLFLAACGAQPAPEFFNASRADVTREGRQYTVFYTQSRVEVIRLGSARNGEHQGIRAQMIALIPEVTGCKLIAKSLQGDSGEMRGSIRC